MTGDPQTPTSDQKTSKDPQTQPDLPLVIVRQPGTDLVVQEPGAVRRALRAARFIPVVMALVMTGGVIGLYFQPPGLQKVMAILNLTPGAGTSTPIAVPAPRKSSGEAAQRPARDIVGLGKLLPEGEVVTIAPPYGAGDARIASLKVREGDRIDKGAIVAVLDNEAQLLAAVDSAQATVAAREASLAQAKASITASREEAQAALARVAATAANAQREFERAEQLRRSGFTTDTAFEQRRTAREETAREVERLKASLSRFGGDLDAQPDVLVATRTLGLAKADLARARADLEKAYVRAPMAATVLTILSQPGEKPGVNGIMNLGDIAHMKAEVEIYQTQIGQISLGNGVQITADALGAPLHGTVSRIGLEVGKQTLVDASPAANTDARVVKITVALDPESSALASRYTNLQVIARISPGAPP
jgi:HlyD family secretion protein